MQARASTLREVNQGYTYYFETKFYDADDLLAAGKFCGKENEHR